MAFPLLKAKLKVSRDKFSSPSEQEDDECLGLKSEKNENNGVTKTAKSTNSTGSGDYDGDGLSLSPRKILVESSSINIPKFRNVSNSNSTDTGFDESINSAGGTDNNANANVLDDEEEVDRTIQNDEREKNLTNLDNSNYFTPRAKVFASAKAGQSRPVLAEFREIHDLTKLNCITLENVLECLRERYRCQQYYTFAGPILLSLNSCQRLPRASLIEDISRMSRYFINDSSKKNDKEDNENINQEKAPHVYDIGRQCLKNLLTVGSHQIVLVSGESGAGKTTATQQLIKYLTENNSRNFGANVCSNLDKKIYYATIILESFGNAKTQQNPNSSRFGRLVQLNYEKSKGRISGAEIQTYLLEKHRVAKYDYRCERSFHIFYYVLLGLKNELLRLPNNVVWSTLKALTPVHLILDALECEEEEIHRLKQAVQAFNMDDDFSEIVTILYSMITLLNVEFVPDCDSSSEDEHYNNRGNDSPTRTEFTVSDWNCAQLAADLLGVKDSELVDILIARKITAGNSHRHSIFRKPCERQSECEERLHALTSFIYDRLFSYVLDNLNSSLKGDCKSNPDDFSTISLLDLYGFENFNINHLEQICINYANERLQQINISIVKSYYEQSVSDDEILVPPTELIKIENELYHRIDELHSHIFAFFDEECLLKRISEDKDVLERMNMNLAAKRSRFIRTGRPHETECKFTVLHYATKVEYQLSGIVQKNKDHIPPEFQDILKSSSNDFVHSLFKYDLIRSRNASGAAPLSPFTVSGSKSQRGKTILTRFKTSVEELMNRLKSTENNDIHFIRCIRPNTDLLAGNFSMTLVEKQLHACGIADVVKIAGNGYPIRIHSAKFLKEFPKIISCFCNGTLDSKILSLIFCSSANPKPLKFGKKLIFMAESCWKGFKKTEKFLALHHVRIIQKAWRNLLERRDMMKRSRSLNITSEASIPNDSQELDYSMNQSWSSSMHCDSMDLDISDILNESNHSIRKFSRFTESEMGRKKCSPLYYGSGIASRTPVHTLPIKIYLKKTCLPFAEKQPRRLTANGIQDAFEDYGIVFFQS